MEIEVIVFENGVVTPKKVENNLDAIKLASGYSIDDIFEVITRRIGDKYYDIWIDEEGLLKSEPVIAGINQDAEEFLCGNFVITSASTNSIKGLSKEDIGEILFGGHFIKPKMDFIVNYQYWTILAKKGNFCLKYGM